jgi:signal transduction histidine kinase
MLQGIKIMFQKFKLRLPENQLKKDYVNMLQKLRKLEAQIDNNAKQLELAKSSFLKNLYHEIRTPLNAIMGFMNLLSKDYKITDTEKEEYLSVINKSSNDFLQIMDDIIQASLLEADMIKISNEECNLGKFLDELHSYFTIRKHLLEKDCIALLMNVSESYKDVNIVFDKYRLSQVMNHLLENALKFTEKGIIEFGCNIKNQKLEFFVKDTGIGDLSGKENFIFSRFAKVNITDSSKNGLGLGLSNSKKIVELMDGKIWYTSNKEKGSCFYFSIPFVAAEPSVSTIKQKSGFLVNVINTQNSMAV